MKIDLHRHIEGSLRAETILDLADKHGVSLPGRSIHELLPHISVSDSCEGLLAFLDKFRWGAAVLADAEACRRVARECVEDAAREGLEYVELRFSPAFMASAHRLDLSTVVGAVAEGLNEAAQATGLPTALIGCISRGYGKEAGWAELHALLRHAEKIVAVDLAGDEANFPARVFAEHFAEVHRAGLPAIAHAGEAAGPESILEAIEMLGATRIGHATRAPEDPSLPEMLARHHIGLECCLTSNLHTACISHLSAHPLASFLDAGLLATINTDDPAISRITFDHELQQAAPAAGLTPTHIQAALANARSLAFALPKDAHPIESTQ